MAIAVYAGTFDPITSGHLSVIQQAARLFGHVRVLVATNPEKAHLFSSDERSELIREAVARMPNVSVDTTDGMVVVYARSIGASFLVRGIRGESDAAFETELAQANRALAPEISTILLPAETHLSRVSSSGLKQAVQSGDGASGICPDHVERALRDRFAQGVSR